MGSRGMAKRRNWAPVLAPLAVGAAMLAFGHPLRASVIFALAGVVAVLVALGVDVAGALGRGAVAVGSALSVALNGLVFVALILPASGWSRLRGHDLASRRRSAVGWQVVPGNGSAPRSLGSATPGASGRRPLASRLTWTVGCVAVVLALNFGAGWLWDSMTGRSGPDSLTSDGPGPTTTVAPVTTTAAPDVSTSSTTSTTTPRPVPRDVRADSPAMAAYPWREQYLDDMQRAPVVYWPYTGFRPLPYTSAYLNIDGWTRRTYRTPGPNTGRPRVWMYGGSTTWGEGQRDEYTIASWLARLAEEDGIPIEIENYGQRGWTHFQDMILYEQRLALDDPPDLAVFYDGINETNTQSLVPEAVPSNYQVTENQEAMGERRISTRVTGPVAGTAVAEPEESSLLEEVQFAYSEHSMVHKVLRFFSAPAGAQEDPEDKGPPQDFVISVQDGIDAGKVYERAKQLTLNLSRRYDVATLFYWQPASAFGPPELSARDQVTDPTIDISELLLDHQEVFLDGAHTNEEGARLVAERIWEDLETEVRAWYEAND